MKCRSTEPAKVRSAIIGVKSVEWAGQRRRQKEQAARGRVISAVLSGSTVRHSSLFVMGSGCGPSVHSERVCGRCSALRTVGLAGLELCWRRLVSWLRIQLRVSATSRRAYVGAWVTAGCSASCGAEHAVSKRRTLGAQRQLHVEVGGVVALLPGQPLAVKGLEHKLHAAAAEGGEAEGGGEQQPPGRGRRRSEVQVCMPPPSTQADVPWYPATTSLQPPRPPRPPHPMPCCRQSLSGRRTARPKRAGSTNTGEPSSAAME